MLGESGLKNLMFCNKPNPRKLWLNHTKTQNRCILMLWYLRSNIITNVKTCWCLHLIRNKLSEISSFYLLETPVFYRLSSCFVLIVRRGKRSEMDWALKRTGAVASGSAIDSCCMRLQGLPYECKKDDVEKFLEGKLIFSFICVINLYSLPQNETIIFI